MTKLEHVRTSVLDVAYESTGSSDALPVVLLHGFPYDPRCFDDVVSIVAARGHRVIVPYLRGFGGTRFLSSDTIRSGEQAAMGQDLLELLDALKLKEAVLGGFDWGARAACIVSALWPERVRGLVSCCGYQIQNIANAAKPADPEQERRFWYQYYFHTDRGRAGLAANRRELCRLCWQLWSPTWRFDDGTYDRTAASFDNPDFVDVVIHSYRHRHGNVASDPRYSAVESRLVALPKINVPTVVLHGAVDGVNPHPQSEGHAKNFTSRYDRRLMENVGHNPPQEAPADFAKAILECCD